MSSTKDLPNSVSSLSQWATWREIHSQPDAWLEWIANFDVVSMREWVESQDFNEVWFCGAGSSAYIGDILAAGLSGKRIFRSVASTDLVSSPQHFLNGRKPLVVNFGRSGNSAESIGTLDALDAFAPTAPRINITCTPDSALATRTSQGELQVVLMPAAAVDTGFAMTCSFSAMLLTGLAIFDEDLQEAAEVSERVSVLADQLRRLLPQFAQAFSGQAVSLPERAVFLGVGPMCFAAREAALKVLELTAGQIPSLWDSTLGFRHGPKSFVTDNTVINVFMSPETPAKYYDRDLIAELRSQFPKARLNSIGPGGDIDVAMPYGALWAVPVVAAFAQIAGVIWADAQGRNVDDPFAGLGTLTRVVADVALYPAATA